MTPATTSLPSMRGGSRSTGGPTTTSLPAPPAPMLLPQVPLLVVIEAVLVVVGVGPPLPPEEEEPLPTSPSGGRLMPFRSTVTAVTARVTAG